MPKVAGRRAGAQTAPLGVSRQLWLQSLSAGIAFESVSGLALSAAEALILVALFPTI
jgi:hypothetical protein